MPVAATSTLSSFTGSQKVVIGYEQDEVANLEKLLSSMSINDLEHLGYALTNLVISSKFRTEEGDMVYTLGAPVAGTILPPHTLRTGDEVEIVGPGGEPMPKTKGKKQVIGVVLKVMGASLHVFVGKGPPIPASWARDCAIKVVANDVSYKRMLSALSALSTWKGARPDLHNVLFGNLEPKIDAAISVADSEFFDSSLNTEQRQAVNFALASKEISLIHGPPGTGKTHTLVEIIRQLVRQGKKLLVCGPSNVSVDNIVERLGKAGDIPIVRFGHPARVSKSARGYTPEAQAAADKTDDEITKCSKELSKTMRAIRRCKDVERRQDLRVLAKAQRKVVNKLTAKASKVVAQNSKVVLTTLCGSGGPKVTKLKINFDVVVIDESAQALEGECWIAGVQAPKLVLAGDHHQLPPTLISSKNQSLKKTAASDNVAGNGELLTTTMFERVRNKFGDRVCHMLTTQYRMHALIMKVSNEHLYDGRLVAHHSVASHVLCGLPDVEILLSTAKPLLFIDTAEARKRESFERSNPVNPELKNLAKVGQSRVNFSEAHIAIKHARHLIASGVRGEDIAIITPYNGQVRILKQMRKSIPGVKIGSIDGFQGSEKEAVILSLVRSNSKMKVGFLDDYRRINVAITRARRQLCVIADSRTISGGGDFLSALVTHLQTHGDVRMVI